MSEVIATHGLTHIALKVRDAERAFRFYAAVFGMVAIYREPGWIQAQTPGARDVLVLEEDADAVGRAGGVAHFGFRLVTPAGIAAAARVIEQAGGTVLEQGEFVPGEPFVFFTDLDGYQVEVWYELPTAADPPGTDRDGG